MRNLAKALRLCLVVGRSDCKPYDLFHVVGEAIKGGVTSIQLRDKHADDIELADLGKQLLRHLPSHVPLIINDHIGVAKYLGVHVHVGQSDHDPASARQILGPNAIIGFSIEHAGNLTHLPPPEVIDYYGIGAVFPTRSKTDSRPIGLQELIAIVAQLHPKPCIAIGGINQTNITDVFATGVDGVALISAITKTYNPCWAARRLLERANAKATTRHSHHSRV